ncbi:hypothetical protein [Mycobacterium arosiense]|uniref:Uncharacterized protein n=1 Tax=Mycobacterium arosiense ATCC BAA-1401 = DSM 45069 TaxID=1265311 RepID=A0A1W9ZQ06_MYCAI|nr:hypothetical protein [Mycobacterium arosiense]ORA19870.1 hypothetical protein BST14_03825 [Mycobacterium arosiense ATCC BAA-1401 = DSM 45069]
MTVIAVIAALAIAACFGYYLGQRATSAPPSWKKRTSRIALSKQAINLLAMITVRRIQQRLRAERVVPETALRYGWRIVAPLHLRRGGAVRLRSL